MSFGKQLNILRKSKNWTQSDLAKIAKISRGTVSMYEIGKRDPDTDTLRKFSEIFNVSVDFLLDNDTKPAIIPDELKKIGVEYIALAKTFQDNEIPPEDVEKLLKVLKDLKK